MSPFVRKVVLITLALHAVSGLAFRNIGNTMTLLKAVTEGRIPAHQAPTRKELSQAVFELQSFALCDHVNCAFEHAVFDPDAEKCICPWAKASIMEMALTEADRRCQSKNPCPYPFASVSDPSDNGCVCSVLPLPPSGNIFPYLHEPSSTPEHYKLSRGWWMRHGIPGDRAYIATLLTGQKSHFAPNKVRPARRDVHTTIPRDPNTAHLPPTDVRITREQLQDLMTAQPNQTATVASIVPHFAEGTVTFSIQLEGPVAQTILLNATDTLPCDEIGLFPQPSIVLVPRTAKNGTLEVIVPDCSLFAVNMYNSSHIRYWVTKPDSSVFMLEGSNKIEGIDQLNLTGPTAVSIRAVSDSHMTKRSLSQSPHTPPIRRHQLLAIPCDHSCPHKDMTKTAASKSSKLCGCAFTSPTRADSGHQPSLAARAVTMPDAYTAIMTLETCRSMTCLNNGGNPALYNPFSKTCWCAGPVYIDVNPSAYSGGD